MEIMMDKSARVVIIVAGALIALAACSKASLPGGQAGQDSGSVGAPPSGSQANVGTVPGATREPANAGQSANTEKPKNTGLTPDQQADWNAIEALEAQAKALARIDGCASSGDCRTAPVGSRGCGGPRYYIAWCAKTTDSAALYRKLGEVANAEKAYNRKYQIGSTCEFRESPLVTASGGSCVTQ
jgi:hypothetical protein